MLNLKINEWRLLDLQHWFRKEGICLSVFSKISFKSLQWLRYSLPVLMISGCTHTSQVVCPRRGRLSITQLADAKVVSQLQEWHLPWWRHPHFTPPWSLCSAVHWSSFSPSSIFLLSLLLWHCSFLILFLFLNCLSWFPSLGSACGTLLWQP